MVVLENDRWAEMQFGECELGDLRRTRRAVRVAAHVVACPDGSTPTQMRTWADCKAAYRLFDCEQVTFEAICRPHWNLTKARGPGDYLLIGDTTELDFGIWRDIEGLGTTGSGGGLGFFLHSGLMLDAGSGEILGLAGQILHYREPAPRGESPAQRLKRPRESDLWGQLIEQVGPPSDGARFIHVFDRGADNFEVLCRLLFQKGDWVIRAAQLVRRVFHDDQEIQLQQVLSQRPCLGTYDVEVRRNKQQPARTAHMEVRVATVGIYAPQHRSPWLKECGVELITSSVIEVREVRTPQGAEPLRWVLYSSLPAETFEDAWKIIAYYEKRPAIEEFHKSLKSGCRAQARMYRNHARLEAVTGLNCVVAVRLLQLRDMARTNPESPANEVVPRPWIRMLSRASRRPIRTVREFIRGVAQLGGFLGRKGDGEPGWMTIWRGIDELQSLLLGAALARKCG